MANIESSAQRHIVIFDTTLRDGEQSPGASMNLAEKMEVAQALVELGVDVIEAGFPISSVGDFEAAVEKLRWYTLRWGIEVFHRVLKSGCQIETRRLGQADRLEACLGIDLVVAWRIYHLTKLGRETPSVPATVYFEEH